MLKKRFSKVLLGLPFLLISGAEQVSAQTSWRGTDCVGTGVAGSLGDDVATVAGLGCLMANILSVVLTFFTLVGFVMFVIGGLRYMISGGQPQQIEKAKNTLTYAVIGIVLAIGSIVILNIISAFTGVDSIFSVNFNI